MNGTNAFEVAWKRDDVLNVLQRVREYPWPEAPAGDEGWGYGCDATYLRELCAFWTDGYDWTAAVEDLNRYPQFVANIGGVDLHFVHVVGEGRGRRPLLLTHGWPGSHFEFWEVIDKLAFPSRYGGDAADAFDVVAASLPGYGFSSKPRAPIGPRAIARLLDALMKDVLGYAEYLAQGGDWGAAITSWLGKERRARAIHLNSIGLRPHGPPQGEVETEWFDTVTARIADIGAYGALQGTRPQSLSWLAAGNPVGQAAWITERFHDWSDLRTKSFDQVHPKSALLTNIMIYVMTGSLGSAGWLYRGMREEGGWVLPAGERCETPTALALFPGDPFYSAPPRSWAERAYNIVRWTDIPRGGHFAAMEEPDLFVQDLRAWASELELVRQMT